MGAINWIKKLINIVKFYDMDRRSLHLRIDELERILKERTDIAVDIRHRGMNHVIVVGRYKNRDFVQTYTLAEFDLGAMIDILKSMERYGSVKCVYAPPAVRSVFAANEIMPRNSRHD